jgi:hypothetical protein
MEEEKLKTYPSFKVSKPTLVESLVDISEISCGEECMAAINDMGKLFTWGNGKHGILGHGDEEIVYTPKQVENLYSELVIQVKCGLTHMACITDNKEIYTWGSNFLGALGRVVNNSDVDAFPGLVELVQIGDVVSEENLKQSDELEFVQIECIRYNTLALTSEGQLFICGKGGSDGSAHGDQPHTLLCLVNSLANKIVHTIYPSSGCHVAALVEDEDGVKPYIWGNGEDGKLGNGSTESIAYPVPLEFDTPRDCYMIACGDSHCAAVLEPMDSDINPDPTMEFFIESAEDEELKLPEQSKPAISNTKVEKVAATKNEPQNINALVINEAVSNNSVNNDHDISDDDDDTNDEEIVIQDITPIPSVATTTTTTTTTTPTTNAETSNANITSKMTTSITPSTTPDSPFISGYLSKKGEKGFVKLWKKRFFIMDSKEIVYYTKENGIKKGSIKISEIINVTQGQAKFGLNVVSKSGRTYELQGASQSDVDKWKKAISSLIKK